MKLGNKLPIFLAAVLACSLAACGGNKNKNNDSSAAPLSSSDSGDDSSQALPDAKTGITSLVGASAAERTEVLGALEKYAVDNMITGMPLYENGGYTMYNPRVVKGCENYITGYGFGIGRYGYLRSDLTNEEVAKPSYYNTWDTSDPGKINYLDDQGSQVGDYFDTISCSYFGTKMNAAKNGYDWYGVLSTKDRPYIVKDGVASYPEDKEALSDTWRVYVRTGQAGGVAFRTNSTAEGRAAFDNKYVTLDDYVSAFKILLCGKFAYYRGTEAATKMSGYSAIKGAGTYYANTKSSGISDEEFKKVGVKSGHDDTNGDYLEFQLGAPTTRFYAMYSLASTLYSPINMEFFNLVTNNGANPKNYGAYSSDKSTGPVDNILSLGPWLLEEWKEDQIINFKRNDEWYERKADSNLYRIPGYSYRIWEAGKEDENYGFQQFLDGKIDGSRIPQDYVEQYRNDDRTTTTTGTSVFKLNVNSCTQEQWNSMFGDAGTVARLGDNKYTCKPWMSNTNFVKGLFFSIDRNAYAAKRGSISSINYFSSNYMMDAEEGIGYNATDTHKNAIADFWGDTMNTGGYSKALSQAAFNEAISELFAAGKLKDGDTLDIECWWMMKYQETKFGDDIATFVADSFDNCTQAKQHKLKVNFINKSVDVWSDVYTKHLQVGQFDIGFGSISGNPLDPLNFMEVLKSDNSSGFTLNWGADTSKLGINYKGEAWSYNTLWAAVDHGVVTYKGEEIKPASLSGADANYTAANGLVVSYAFSDIKTALAKQTDDIDAQAIANLSAEEYDVSIVSVDFSVNVGYGMINISPDGHYDSVDFYDPDTEDCLWSQYYDDTDGKYYTFAKNGVESENEDGDEEEPWVTIVASNLTYKDPNAEEKEVTSGSFVVTIKPGLAEAFCGAELIAIELTFAQNIRGLESNGVAVVTVPAKGYTAPAASN